MKKTITLVNGDKEYVVPAETMKFLQFMRSLTPAQKTALERLLDAMIEMQKAGDHFNHLLLHEENDRKAGAPE